MRGGKQNGAARKGGCRGSRFAPPLPSPSKQLLPAPSQDSGQSPTGEGQGLAVPRASRPWSQGTAVHGPELHLRAFVGLWEPAQESAGTGDGGMGWEPSTSWGPSRPE